jgi:hypothetical protein
MVDVPSPLETPYLDPAHVARVVTLDDLLERNAAITHGYHSLSEAVATILGRQHANWLTFGQWASAEARASIAGQTVPAPLRHLLAEHVSEAVAQGNAAIFGDVAPPFIRFVTLYRYPGRLAPGLAARQALRAQLLADPTISRSADLLTAFGAYADVADLLATDDPDPRSLAARMFVANVCVGAHEQLLADPFIRVAIPGRWFTAIVATSQMRLLLPDRELALDRDVPHPAYLDGEMFPEPLRELDDPDATALARRFRQQIDSASRSDAPDWEDFEERMGFIFTLFRAYQCDPTLYAMPPGVPDPPRLLRG